MDDYVPLRKKTDSNMTDRFDSLRNLDRRDKNDYLNRCGLGGLKYGHHKFVVSYPVG